MPSLAPSSVTVVVLNASNKQGQATTVAKELQASASRPARPATTQRHGRSPASARSGTARAVRRPPFLGLYLPGATDYQDTRATGTVDLVIGPTYAGLATPGPGRGRAELAQLLIRS